MTGGATKRKETYCRICEAACGLVAEVDENGRVADLKPDGEHPISEGFACAKGTRFHRINRGSDRITSPKIRNQRGDLISVGWDEAYDRISRTVRPLLEEFGPHTLGFYVGNPLAFNSLGAVSLLGLINRVGTRNTYSAGSQDCNNKFAGSDILHGSPIIHPIPDFENTDLALLFGTNPAVSQSSFVHLEGGSTVLDGVVDRGGEVICVDPRETESARRWGNHVPIRPGTDVFLMLALLDELSDRYRSSDDEDGLGRLLEFASKFPVKKASEITGLPEERIRTLAEKLRTVDRAALHMSVGVNQGGHGTLSYLCLHALAYLTDNLDEEGGLLFHPLATRTARLLETFGWDDSDEQSRVGNFSSVLDTLPGGILSDEITTEGPQRIRAMIVAAGNPLKSIPGERDLADAFERLDCLIGVDTFENETARYADVLLPVPSWLERWDLAGTTMFFQKDSRLQMAGPVTDPPEGVRSEHRIYAELSNAVGRPLLGSRWLTGLLARAPLNTVLGSLSGWLGNVPGFPDHGAVPVPSPSAGDYLGQEPLNEGNRLCFWESALNQEVERVRQTAERFLSSERETSTREPETEEGFTLICRRRRLGHNSWIHNAGREDGETEAWLARKDLNRFNLESGDRIKIVSESDELTIPCAEKEGVPEGTVVVPHGLENTNVNALIPNGPERIEPTSGMSTMTGIDVQLEPVKTPPAQNDR